MTDAEGRYSFRTVRPGPYPFPNNGCSWRPAHVHLSLFGAAFGQRLITQFYFEGDPLIGIAPSSTRISDPKAIDQLVAKLDLEGQVEFDSLAYRSTSCCAAATRPGSRRARRAHEPEEDAEGNPLADGRSLRTHRPHSAAGRLRHFRQGFRQHPGRPGPRASASVSKGASSTARVRWARRPGRDLAGGCGGQYAHPADRQDKALDPHFRGWGRPGPTSTTGACTSTPSSPAGLGRTGAADGIARELLVFARGINLGRSTRMYFEDEAAANADRSRAQRHRAATAPPDAARAPHERTAARSSTVRHPPAGRPGAGDGVLRRVIRSRAITTGGRATPHRNCRAEPVPRGGPVRRGRPRRNWHA